MSSGAMDYEEIPISEMIWNMGIQLRLPNVWIQKMAKLSSIRILINRMCLWDRVLSNRPKQEGEEDNGGADQSG